MHTHSTLPAAISLALVGAFALGSGTLQAADAAPQSGQDIAQTFNAEQLDFLISTGVFDDSDLAAGPAAVSDEEFDRIVAEMRAAEKSGQLRITAESEQMFLADGVESTEMHSKIAGQIPHNQVRAFGGQGGWGNDFKPTLKVSGGCVPFPAVQADGRWSGGLESTGSANGGCSSNGGQIYVRAWTLSAGGEFGGGGARCAAMYSWYFPKDGNVTSGHRHDWENVVVWLTACNSGAQVIAVSYSGHGKYDKYRGSANTFSGKRVRVKYAQTWPLNFQLFRTSDNGGSHPMVDWGNGLTPAARDTLNNANFGKANVPMKDANWANNLRKAKFW